ncbi:MAG TPA: SMC family ATPase [Leptospiraceae bacterium]|nr:SMC family ATPase [Leptospiraceae bacterium]
MIPLHLSFSGFNSYRTVQSVDFRKLLSSRLFGIFGETGSGKSSILDAMTLALYNTEKGKGTDSRNQNIMNLSSESMMIDFICDIGGKEYRFQVKAKRKKDGTVDSLSRNVFEKSGGEWLKIRKTGEELLGISLSNFRKTVIIPQSSFQEFIELPPAKRTEVLKELFSLDRFDLTEEVRKLLSSAKENQKILEGKILQLGSPDESVLSDKKNRLAAAETSLEFLRRETQIKRTQLKEYELLMEKHEKKIQLEKEYEEILKQESSFLERKKNTERMIHISSEFRDISRRLNDEKKMLTDKTSLLKDLVKNIAYEEKQIQIERNGLEKLRSDKESALQEHSRIPQIRFLTEWKKKSAELEHSKKVLIQNAEKRKDNLRALNVLTGEVEKLRQELTVLRSETDSISDTFEKLNLLKRKEEILNQIHSEEKKVRDIGENKEKILSSVKCRNSDDISFIIKREKKNAEDLQKKINSLKVRIELKNYSENLKEGEPCPVCGSTFHDISVLHSENITDELHYNEKLLHESEKLNSEAEKAERVLENLNKETEIHSKIINDLKKNFGEESDEKQLKSGIQELQNHYSIQKKKKDEISFKEKHLQTQEKKLEENREAARREEKIESEQSAQITVLASAAEFNRKNVTDEVFLKYGSLGTEKTAELILDLEKKKTEAEKKFTAEEDIIKKREEKQSSLRGRKESEEENLSDREKRFSDLKKEYEEKIKVHDTSEEEILKSLSFQNAEKEKEEIEKFFQSKKNKEAVLKSLEMVESVPPERRIISGMKEAVVTMENEISALDKEAGTLLAEIKDLQERIASLKETVKEKESLDARVKNIEILESMFKGNGFEKYISGVYFREICEMANERFYRLSSGGLRLNLDSENQLSVVDYWNDGKTRSIKTLSGGQTFQAALSLALALSDRVQRDAFSRQNFFFIDEGFGSLDRNSLQTVFDTLKSLRNENKYVGIISHMEEIQSEMNCYLNVRYDRSRGSLIRGSWEI